MDAKSLRMVAVILPLAGSTASVWFGWRKTSTEVPVLFMISMDEKRTWNGEKDQTMPSPFQQNRHTAPENSISAHKSSHPSPKHSQVPSPTLTNLLTFRLYRSQIFSPALTNLLTCTHKSSHLNLLKPAWILALALRQTGFNHNQ